ncbi:hypothetical protein JCM10449v2_002334 [Rhodotorula kratochvilovae]
MAHVSTTPRLWRLVREVEYAAMQEEEPWQFPLREQEASRLADTFLITTLLPCAIHLAALSLRVHAAFFADVDMPILPLLPSLTSLAITVQDTYEVEAPLDLARIGRVLAGTPSLRTLKLALNCAPLPGSSIPPLSRPLRLAHLAVNTVSSTVSPWRSGDEYPQVSTDLTSHLLHADILDPAVLRHLEIVVDARTLDAHKTFISQMAALETLEWTYACVSTNSPSSGQIEPDLGQDAAAATLTEVFLGQLPHLRSCTVSDGRGFVEDEDELAWQDLSAAGGVALVKAVRRAPALEVLNVPFTVNGCTGTGTAMRLWLARETKLVRMTWRLKVNEEDDEPVAFVPLVALAASLDTAAAATLADGKYFQAGSISSTWRWQASGTLSTGRCPLQVVKLGWSACYNSQLGATGNLQSTTQADYLASLGGGALAATTGTAVADQNGALRMTNTSYAPLGSAEQRALADDEDLDAYFEAFPDQLPYRFPYHATSDGGPSFKAKRQVVGCGTGGTTTPPASTTTTAPGTTPTAEVSPRQRNEIFTWPGAVAGQTWKYTWKTWQTATSTNYNFHHAWQLLRRDGCGGAVITLDYLNGQVVITDTVRDCKPCAKYLPGINFWFNKEVSHEMTVTLGLNGAITYKAFVLPNTRAPAVYYTAKGDMGSSTSLKFGNYRKYVPGQQASTNYIGDFVQTRLA